MGNLSAHHILTRITAPSGLFTLPQAKAHLRVDHADEDVYIQELIDSVTASLDGPNGAYGFPVTNQRWQIVTWGPDRDGRLSFPITPVRAIHSVAYWPLGGGSQVVHTSTPDLANWTLWANDDWAYMVAASGVWPALADRFDALTVQFDAGYAEVPPDIKQAGRLALAGMYENRADMAAGSMRENPALENLIALRRRWWLSS